MDIKKELETTFKELGISYHGKQKLGNAIYITECLVKIKVSKGETIVYHGNRTTILRNSEHAIKYIRSILKEVIDNERRTSE